MHLISADLSTGSQYRPVPESQHGKSVFRSLLTIQKKEYNSLCFSPCILKDKKMRETMYFGTFLSEMHCFIVHKQSTIVFDNY